MDIKIEPILIEQKSVLAQLLNLYDYDFTEYTNNDIKDNGYFYDYGERFFSNYNLHPFFIQVDGKLTGFVIVGDGGYKYLEDENAHNINEFFVMKKYRRNGVGRFVAETVFNMYKGKWEVCQMQNNIPARKFWKSVIYEHTKNDYQGCGTENDEMVGFIFDNSYTN